MIKRLLGFNQLRFSIVGALNTSVDFFIFLLLTTTGLLPVVSNIISTSCGMLCSYLLNRLFVFGPSDNKTHQEIIKFLSVTLFGLWILQNLVILGCNWFLGSLLNLDHGVAMNLMSKILATSVSLVWNYYWYKNYVFKSNTN